MFVSEKDWLGNSGNSCELAQKIVVAVKGDLTHDAVQRAGAILAENLETKKKGKALRALLDALVPKEPMTAEKALEVFAEICATGNLSVCLAQMPDEIKAMSEQFQKESYLACANAIERVDIAMADQCDKWRKEADDLKKPVQLVTGAAPAAPATAPATAPTPPAAEADEETTPLDETNADLAAAELAAA